MNKKEYICECGQVFNNPQKFNGHKQGCEVHILTKYNSLEDYYIIKNRSVKQGAQTQKEKWAKQKEEELQQWISEEHKCEVCGKIMIEYYGTGRFCGPYCAHSAKKKHRYCLTCGKELTNRQKKYCSSQCQQVFQHEKYIVDWKNGLKDGNAGLGQISEHIRNYLLKENDYKCEQCGWSGFNPVTNNSVLEIHHIDGDWSNNKPDNLQVLCPNCHALTSTYRRLNADSSRERNGLNRKKHNNKEED